MGIAFQQKRIIGTITVRCECFMTIKTKFGTANIGANGYYKITTSKEGNNNKLLHRLIYESFWNVKLPREVHIHHKDGNKHNNCILNLEALLASDHIRLHGLNQSKETRRKISEAGKGRIVSEATRKKISDAKTGTIFSEETRKNMSKSQNTTGYFRVSKQLDPKMKKGYRWRYCYTENYKQKCIKSVDLDLLKDKVIAKGLPWIKLDNKGGD